jgi:hypothetical protein
MKLKASITDDREDRIYDLPEPGDVVIWKRDGDVLLRLANESASSREVLKTKGHLMFQSLKTASIFIITISDVRQAAQPAKAVSVDEDGTVVFALA